MIEKAVCVWVSAGFYRVQTPTRKMWLKLGKRCKRARPSAVGSSTTRRMARPFGTFSLFHPSKMKLATSSNSLGMF